MTTFSFLRSLSSENARFWRVITEETMEFQQLEMFAAVVETGNLSRAAERVSRTAPAVSIALRKLEEEMGVPLFDRSDRHNHQLTAAGKLLYSHATRILELRREATASVKDLIQGEGRNLRLGTYESTSLYLLPSLLQTFHEMLPGVQAEVLCGNSERLLKALSSREIELALIADAPEEEGIERRMLMEDELVLITGPGHRLAGSIQIELGDLAGEFLLVQGTKSMLRERIVQALKESGTPFRLGVENIAIEAIKRMVAEGLGIGFVPLMCVREEAARGTLVTLHVNGVSNKWNLWLVWRRDHSLSSAARAFIEVSLAFAQSAESAEGITTGPREENSAEGGNSKSFKRTLPRLQPALRH
jgi:DNA-binding transcriptional LysR family regulator